MRDRFIGLQRQHDLLVEKIERLREAVAIETDPEAKFKYEKQIEQNKGELDNLEKEIKSVKRKFGQKKYIISFLLILFLLWMLGYKIYDKKSVFQLVGIIKEVGQNTYPAGEAEIAASHINKITAKSNSKGNFELLLPTSNSIKDIELRITYQGQTFYRIIQNFENTDINIEIPSKKTIEEEFSPFQEETFGILIAPFQGITEQLKSQGILRQHEIESILNYRFRKLGIHESEAEARKLPFNIISHIENHDEARKIGGKYNADIVIWGNITERAIIPNLTIINTTCELSALIESETSFLVPLSNLDDIQLSFLTNDPTFLVSFITGLKYYNSCSHEKALEYFTKSLSIKLINQDADITSILNYTNCDKLDHKSS